MSIAASLSLPLFSSGAERRSANAPSPTQMQTPLPARRFDLTVQEQQQQGQKLYFVKDSMTLRYYRFAAAEFLLFQLLDGVRTLDDVQLAFAHEVTLRGIPAGDLLPLIQRWQRAGLLQESGAIATARILAAQQRSQGKSWLSWVSSVLYLKVRAFDPDPLLNRIYPWVRWLFRPVGVCLAVGTMCSAVLLVAARFEEFTSQPEVQDFHAFFNLQNIVWLWLAVGIVKMLHEFGHGLTCKHFGGECHAMGLLLMCFTPCLYCDVSDSWMLPNKWHRIAIAAAGIYVELLVASLATFVWWSTVPGVLHSIAFSAMLFGSVQTILINANPLMRFDGYYVMSDYLEVPNLRQKSYALANHYLKKWFWGTRAAVPGKGGMGFVLYAVAASVYRVVLTLSMIWFFSRILEPYKLATVGWGLTALAAIGMVIVPVVRGIVAVVHNPAGMRPQSWWRPLLAVVLLGSLLGAFFYAPLPHRAYAVLTLEPAQSMLVATSSGGRIVRQLVVAGQQVHQGDPLVELDNTELRLQSERMEQQRDLLRVQAQSAVAVLDPARSQAVQVALKELESQLSEFHRRIDDLVVRSPCDGRVIPEPERVPQASPSSSTVVLLGGWKRSVLHPENIGAELSAGMPLCQVAATKECVAVAILSQTRVELVKIGQVAAIKLDAFAGETFLGIVREVSVQDVDQVAPQLLNLHGSELPAISSGPNAGRLAEAHYRVRIQLTGLSRGELPDWSARLKPGLRGRTWIRVGSQTVAQVTWRWICQVLQW